jgi:hypothetical protein
MANRSTQLTNNFISIIINDYSILCDKILKSKLHVVRPPQVIVIMLIVMTAAIGLPLQQRATLKITAPRVRVGRLTLTAWRWRLIRASFQNNIIAID